MGVLLLTTGDELLLTNGIDAIFLNADEEGLPGCVYITMTGPGVTVTVTGPSVSIGLTAPAVTITMEEC